MNMERSVCWKLRLEVAGKQQQLLQSVGVTNDLTKGILKASISAASVQAQREYLSRRVIKASVPRTRECTHHSLSLMKAEMNFQSGGITIMQTERK